jgi:hypothetical protein
MGSMMKASCSAANDGALLQIDRITNLRNWPGDGCAQMYTPKGSSTTTLFILSTILGAHLSYPPLT